jgi:outer membrane protein TolC
MFPSRWTAGLAAAVLATSAQAEPMTFDQALARANANAPSLQAASLQVEAARAASRAAGALPDPQLKVGVQDYPISGPVAGRFGADEMTMATVGVVQEVPNGARRRAEVSVAQAEIDSAEAQAQIAARSYTGTTRWFPPSASTSRASRRS